MRFPDLPRRLSKALRIRVLLCQYIRAIRYVRFLDYDAALLPRYSLDRNPIIRDNYWTAPQLHYLKQPVVRTPVKSYNPKLEMMGRPLISRRPTMSREETAHCCQPYA